MTPQAHKIALLLGGPKVRPAGSSGWLTCCPAHDDSTPSLRVEDGETRVLFHCYGGCASSDVARAVQAKHGDALRPPAPANRPRGKFVYRRPGAPQKPKPPIEWAGPTNAPCPQNVALPNGFREVARYAWRTKDGRVHHWVVRGENAAGEKVFVPMSKWRSAKGEGWRAEMPPGRKPLYDSHLDDGRKPVLFVEGEKAAEAAKRVFGAKFWITTAGSWSRLGGTDLEPLGWRDITVSPDLDSPGLGMVAALAGAVGRPISVLMPPPSAWPKDGVGCDIADLEALHGDGLAEMSNDWLYTLGGGAGRRIRIVAVDKNDNIREVGAPGADGEIIGRLAEVERASDSDRAHLGFEKFDFVPDPRINRGRIEYVGNYAILI